MTALVILLAVAAFLALAWAAHRHNAGGDELAQRRRTAEDRLADREYRVERRRRLGLNDDDREGE